MAIASKRFNPITFIADVALNITLIVATLFIVLILTPFVLLYWLTLLVIGNLKTMSYLSAGDRLLKAGKADMASLDEAIRQLLGVDKEGRKDVTAWVREKKRRAVADELISIRRKSFPNDKIHYLS